jgi:hypothetical protein
MAKEKEPLNECDLFAQVTRRIYQDPVWSGKKIPGAAIRTLLWMMDRTTKNFDVDGVIYGQVNYGNLIDFADIATDLSCSWSQIQRATKWLVANNFIHRGRKNVNGGYSFSVLNSTRKFKAASAKLHRVTEEEGIEPEVSVIPTGEVEEENNEQR